MQVLNFHYHMNSEINDVAGTRRNRLSAWEAVSAGLLLAGLCWLANSAEASTALLDFEFNEGSGTNITDQANHLQGVLGPLLDPAATPVVVSSSPSSMAGDSAVSLNYGNDVSQGFLVVDDSNGPILALATNAFTMECWIYIDPTDIRQDEGIGAYGGSYQMGLDNGELVFTLYGVVEITSGLNVPPGSWHHVAAAWQPGVGVTFYLDGASTTPVSDTHAIPSFASHLLTIGADNISGNAVQGMLDRFRIHNAVLTAGQLDSVAATPKAPLSSTLVAYNFNESAPPFQSAVSPSRPAISSNQYLQQTQSPTFTTDTPSGKPGDYALNFESGQSAYVSDPNTVLALDPTAPSFTVQSWVKFNAQPGSRSVLFYNTGTGGAFSFSVTYPDRHVFVSTLGIVDQDSNAVIPDDGGWHHIAVVYESGKDFLFYVDGSLSDTVAYTNGVLFTMTNAACTIGSEPGGDLQYVGSLDRLKVSAGALTPDQLDSLPVPGVSLSAPVVSIALVAQVSWPGLPSGYVLQSSTNLNGPTWTTLTNKPFANNGTYYLLFPTTPSAAFYRLTKP